jgi:hypothetical protein
LDIWTSPQFLNICARSNLGAAVLSVGVRSVGVVLKTRQLLPEGLAEMPPGPGLIAVLDSIDLSRLGGLDCVEVMRARHRQTNHDQARLMAAMVEVALCGIGPDDQLPRMDCPDDFSADEIRGALAWTRSAADGRLRLAWDLIHRLPPVFAALNRGVIDIPKARVFSEWTDGLTDDQALQICDQLLPEAPELTAGQLIDRVKRMAIAIDPDWACRRYEAAVRERKVVGYRNEDGTGNLCGYQLPVDRAAAACAHIDALAKKIKQAGDRRPINHIKADLYLGLLDGSYVGWTESDIIAHILAAAQTETAAHRDDAGGDHREGSAGDERRSFARRSSRTGGQPGRDTRSAWRSPRCSAWMSIRPRSPAGGTCTPNWRVGSSPTRPARSGAMPSPMMPVACCMRGSSNFHKPQLNCGFGAKLEGHRDDHARRW